MPPALSVPTFRHIRTLRLRLSASEELLEWLARLDGSRLPLETLDLRVFRWCHRGWGPVNALNAFLKWVSDTLDHLRLGIDVIASEESLNQESRYIFRIFHPSHRRLRRVVWTGPPVDLSPLVHLSSLFLRTHDLRAVCDALASLPPPCALRALAVHTSPWGLNRLKQVNECVRDPATLLARRGELADHKPATQMRLDKEHNQVTMLGSCDSIIQRKLLVERHGHRKGIQRIRCN
jgi:uncharacterized protein YggT (Ycf19 family)